jgi:hypothetical protein
MGWSKWESKWGQITIQDEDVSGARRYNDEIVL